MNIDWIQVSTIVTAIATVAYAILTIVIVRETVALRKAQTEPNIVLLIQPEEKYPNLYDIRVKNTGTGAAYNLKWHYDKSAELAAKEHIGVNYRRQRRRLWDNAPGRRAHAGVS